MLVVKGGNGFRDYTEANLADPEIKAMVKRVRLEVDKEVEANFPAKRAIRMTIKLKNGKVHQLWLEGARGTPENPMTWADLKEKFTGLASVVLPERRVAELADAVVNLESLGSITTLSRLLVA
jgi:2-methylcitrate dehydratase PrpD